MRKMEIAILAMLLVSSLYVKAQHGVDPNWLSEVELPHPATSSNLRGFLYSNMAVFSNNKRVVFFREKNNITKIYYTYSYDGTNWSSPTQFFPLPGLNSLKVISDQNDNLHLFYKQGPTKLYYSKMDSSFRYLIDHVLIAANPVNGSLDEVYPTVDLKGRIHVMWHDGNIKTATNTECFYARSIDGGMSFSTPVQISKNTSKKSAFPRGQYNAYAGDSLAIFWRDNVTSNNWNIHMVVSTDGGLNWSDPVTINSSEDYQGDPDLVIDPKGRFHLFYHQAPVGDAYWGMRVVYGYSDDLGQTWSPASDFYNNPVSRAQRSYLVEGSRYDIINNTLWTFWKEEDLFGLKGGDMMAAYSLDRGQTWSTPEYISDHDSVSIGFKTAALLPNGGVCVNYESPNYSGSGETRIVYRERQMLPLGTARYRGENNTVIIYPNPIHDVIHITPPGHQSIKSIEIVDLSGKVLRTKFNSNSISIGHFKNGIYLVKITTDKGNLIYHKIIKQ